jgi:hypothetical protein
MQSQNRAPNLGNNTSSILGDIPAAHLRSTTRYQQLRSELGEKVLEKLPMPQCIDLFRQILVVDFRVAMHFARDQKIPDLEILKSFTSAEFRERCPRILAMLQQENIRDALKSTFKDKVRPVIEALDSGADLTKVVKSTHALRTLSSRIRSYGAEIVRGLGVGAPTPKNWSKTTTEAFRFLEREVELRQGRFMSGEVRSALRLRGIEVADPAWKEQVKDSLLDQVQLEELLERFAPNLGQTDRLAIKKRSQAYTPEKSLVRSLRRDQLISRMQNEIIDTGVIPQGCGLYLRGGVSLVVEPLGSGDGKLLCQPRKQGQEKLNLFHAQWKPKITKLDAPVKRCDRLALRAWSGVISTGASNAIFRTEGSSVKIVRANLDYVGTPLKFKFHNVYPVLDENLQQSIVILGDYQGFKKEIKVSAKQCEFCGQGKDWITYRVNETDFITYEFKENAYGEDLSIRKKAWSVLGAPGEKLLNFQYAKIDDAESFYVYSYLLEKDRFYISIVREPLKVGEYLSDHSSEDSVSVISNGRSLFFTSNTVNLHCVSPDFTNRSWTLAGSYESGFLHKQIDNRVYYRAFKPLEDRPDVFLLDEYGPSLKISNLQQDLVEVFTWRNETYYVGQLVGSQEQALFSAEGKRLSPFYERLFVDPVSDQAEVRFYIQQDGIIHETELFNPTTYYSAIIAQLPTFLGREWLITAPILALLHSDDYQQVETCLSAIRNLDQTSDAPFEPTLKAESGMLELSRAGAVILKDLLNANPELLKESIALDVVNSSQLFEALCQGIPKLQPVPVGNEFSMARFLNRLGFGGAGPRFTTPSVIYSDQLRPMGGDPRNDLVKRDLILSLDRSHSGFLCGGIYFGYDRTSHEYLRWAPKFQNEAAGKPLSAVSIVNKDLPVQTILKPIHSELRSASLIDSKGRTIKATLNSKSDGSLEICDVPHSSEDFKFELEVFETKLKEINNTRGALTELLAQDVALADSAAKCLVLPPDIQFFADSIRAKSPLAQIQAVQEFVSKFMYYDLDNGAVAEQKQLASPSEKMHIMIARLTELRVESPDRNQIESHKLFAGVCLDAAELTKWILNDLAIPAGIAVGFQASGRDVLAGQSHAIAVSALPTNSGGIALVEIDSTPSTSSNILQQWMAPILNRTRSSEQEQFNTNTSETEEQRVLASELCMNQSATGIFLLTDSEQKILSIARDIFLYSPDASRYLNSSADLDSRNDFLIQLKSEFERKTSRKDSNSEKLVTLEEWCADFDVRRSSHGESSLNLRSVFLDYLSDQLRPEVHQQLKTLLFKSE